MKTTIRNINFLLLIGILLSACELSVDLEKSREEILKVDQDFSDYSVQYGVREAFYTFAHDSAVILRENSYPIVGREKIKNLFTKGKTPGVTLSWKPSFADVAKSGELGYTYGVYEYTTPDTTMKGTYVSIWKKRNDQSWKYVFDSGNQGLGD
jgi:ketosteroid isomerase-like protein